MKLIPSVALLISGLLVSSQAARADAFVLSNGVVSSINVPGSVPGSTVASGINNEGWIVGSFTDASGVHGFVDMNGIFRTIDVPGGGSTVASGINDAGQVVGVFGNASGSHGFLFGNGVFTTIDFPGAYYTRANAINNAGQIVGFSASGLSFGWVYDNGHFTAIRPDIELLPLGINDAGQVVGTESGTAFLYSNGFARTFHFQIHNAAIEVATGINDAGTIVGWAATLAGVPEEGIYGFIGTVGTTQEVFTMVDLPGGNSIQPLGINNAGDIVGTFTPVPEPAALLLLTSGLAGIAGFRKLVRR